MAPKKKGNKKGDDDWEAELGEVIDPIAAATVAAKEEDMAKERQTEDADDGAGGGGGLMAAIKKNKNKKQKKGKPTEDFVEGEDPPTAAVNDANGGVPTEKDVDLSAKAPEEADMEEEDVFALPTKKGKPSKQGSKQQQQQQQKQGAGGKGEDLDEEDDGEGKLKSKKEKEKEKKEREKQRKKEQAAAKKKTAAPPPPPTSVAKPEPAKLVEEKEPELAPPVVPEASKKKKMPAALAALQKQQEEIRRKQEEEAKREAEEKARVEEEERLAAEAERKREEARALKKQKGKEKKEQLKREGKFLTKSQKEQKERNELRMKQMLAAGGKVAGLEEGQEKKRPVYDKRKKPKKEAEAEAAKKADGQVEPEDDLAVKLEESVELEAGQVEQDAEVAAEGDKKEESDDLDDWEAAAEKAENVKDSWDADTEDEDSKATQSKDNSTINHTKPTERQSNGVKPKDPVGNNVTSNKKQPTRTPGTDSDESMSEGEAVSAEQRAAAQRKEEAAERKKKQHEEALAARSKDNLRSPICCILGHVDTGKTKLLDKIRQTNVQEGEAGGITQQIGATYFPVDAIKQKTQVVNKDGKFEFKVPGLLVIDTPGHESFTNLRSRGSSLCNIAILVVDIMHGLEPQTLESMRLLRDRKTPFIVALNKIDRLYGWKPIANNGFQDSLAMQNKGVLNEFRDRLEKTKVAFAEQGFNSELFFENKSMARNVSLVPTSAHTGEGIPDMLKLLVQLTQERMTNKLMYLSEVECTVLEVKVIEGLGTTIDVILSNGVLREGDRVVLCGLNGAISTNIRALLTPAPLKELRVKSQYIHNKEVKASLGVKVAANDLEHAIAGSRLMVVGPDDDEENLEEEVMSDLENLLNKVSTTGRGVSVQASTLGSLEALLEFLRVSKIPVANISIGPVYKRDVMQAGVMLEKAKEYAVMLCFDVKVDKEAQAYADDVGVKIFTANIIYHLFDDFTKHMAQLAEQKKEDSKLLAVFPAVLSPVAVFNKKDPIVVGVDVVEGNLRLLTPIAAVKTNPTTGAKEVISLGRVQSIERDHKQIPICKKGQPSVAVKIEGANQPLYGRQLEEKDTLYSLISRQSIDTLKEFYRNDVSMEEWALIKKLKAVFDIP
ncbi:MAG: hypothetical protein M1816_006329 [Peltula sp. TS41687]|nr:MAG: hypothetical protein M1816_006329 [Peltula sp. TS41687]